MNETLQHALGSLGWICVGVLAGVLIGRCAQSHDDERSAVAAGAAEWVLDPKTGNVSFHYINSKAGKPENDPNHR